MRILLPLLLTLMFLGFAPTSAFSQCAAPSVTLPADISYCGPRTIAFSTTNPNHQPVYSSEVGVLTYSWRVNGTVVATSAYPTINFPTAGSHTVTVTITQKCGKTETETASDTQIITIEAIPEAPRVDNVAVCTGSSATLWVQNPDPNLLYRWYNKATGALLVWGTSYTLNNATTMQVEIEALTASGCISPRTTATVTASTTQGNGKGIAADQEICAGTAPATLTGNAPASMTFQWLQSTTGPSSGYSPIATARAQTYSPPPLYQTTWFKRIGYEGGCAEESNPVKITVTPIPATPIVSDRLVCYGERAMFTVSNNDGNTVYRWYATASSTTVLGTGPTFITPQPVTGPITYYVEASTTAGSSCYNLVRVAVNANSTPAITNNSISANQAMCTGGKPEPLIGTLPSGGGGGYIYQWQQSTDGGNTFTDVQGANAKDFAPASLKTTTWFRRKVKAASSCPESYSNIIVITVTPMPATIDIDEPMVCYGSPASIVVTNPEPNFTYRWYDVAEGGTLLATGTTFTTAPLTSNKTYYVEATSTAGCYSTRRSVNVTVTPLPAKPTAANVTICEGSGALLSVNPTDASIFYRWYDSNNTLVATGTNYSTPPLTVNTTYYVEAVTKASPGCASPKVAVEVTVTPKIANNSIVSDQVLCSGVTPVALQGTIPTGGGGGYTYQWEQSTDGSLFSTIQGATGVHYAPGALTSTTWYRRKVVATGSCPTSVSNLVKITVNPLPGAPVVSNVTICTGSDATLRVSSPDANLTYRWYSTATGGSVIATGTTYNTGVLTSAKVYYVEAVSASGCISTTRSKVTVSVTPLPGTPEADNAAICAGSNATLTVLAPDANLAYRWYNSETGGTPLATGTNYTTEILTESTVFYVEASTTEGCTSNNRRAVYVNVTPLPAIPDVDNTTICSGDAAVLFVKNPDPTATYNWYLGGSLLASGVTFTTDVLGYSTTFHVEAVSNTATACASPARRAVVVTVTPNIANNSISSAQTICSGSTPATLTGTQPTGGSGSYTYQWERSEDGTNFTSIAGAVSSTYSPGSLTISTWYRRKVKATSGSCPEHVSNAVKVTVSPLPATPLAQNTTICYGERAQLSITSPDPSLTYKWYSTATGGSPIGVGATLQTESLTATTTYYVDATSTAGCTSNRRTVTATIRPLPDMPQAADKTICAGRNATLSVSNPDPALVYRWFSTSGDLLATGTTYTTANLSVTTTYYVEASTVTSPVCTSARKAVVVSVSPIPTMPAAEDVAICTGASAQLAVTSPDVSLTYNWYTSATGGTAVATGNTFNTGTLTSARTYYLEAVTAAGCVSSRSQVNVTVTPLPATPSADNVSICAGAPATLTVKDPSASLSYRWYTAATGGTLLATGNSYSIASVAATTTYYIEAVTAGGCASTSRGTVTIQVTPLPATPDADNATVCAGNSTTLWVKNPDPGLIYRWYEGGTQVATGISYKTEVLNNSVTYQLEAVTNNGTNCVSPSRRTVSVTVTPAITNNTISADQTICSGSTPAAFTGTLPAGDGSDFSYQWERSEDGVNFSIIANATGQSYTAGALNTTTWFRRRVKANNNCPENYSNVIKVTINPLPATPLADNTTTCEGSTATLSVKDPDASYTYRWYTVASGGSILAIGNTITTPAVNATTTYYVEASNSTGCLSPRKAVTVTVTPLPSAPTVADRSICMNSQAILAVTNPSTSLTYRWYDNSGALLATGPSYTTNVLTVNTVYYVEAATIATPSCVSSRSTVIVNVMPLPATPQANDVTICSGSAADLAVKDVDPNLTYKWYGTASGGTPLHTGSTYRTITLTSNRTYYVEAVNAAGCISQNRKAVSVTVVPIPAAPFVSNTTICAGTSATLSVSSPDASLTYRWYDSAGNLLASGSTYTTAILNSSTTYAVEAAALATSGCNSSRRTVTVTVTPLPAAPNVNQPTICAGSAATLVVENPMPSVDYNWYDENEILITTGTTFTTEVLTESTTFYVEAVTSNGCASISKKVVSVKVVQPVSNNTVTSDQTICYGSAPAQLNGSEPFGGGAAFSYQWEKSEDGLNFTAITGATTQHYAPATLTTDTWFRRKVITNGPCKESISNLVKITVTPLPTVPTATNASVCAGSTATLNVTAAVNGYTYRWYNAASGGSLLKAGTSFTTPELQANTTYYVEAVSASGCISPRRAITVTVTPTPGSPVVANKTVCTGSQAVLSVSAPEQSLVYKWYNSIGEQVASGANYTTPALAATTTYYVEAATTTAPYCVSGRTTVVVTVTDLPPVPAVEDVSICAGEAATLAVLVVDPSYTYKWYTAATGGTAVGSGATYKTSTLTSGRTYYVEAVSAAGCASKRESVVVTVTPLPATPSATNVNVCAGQSAVLSVNSPDANLTYRWYNAATDGTLLTTGDTYTTPALNASETYYVEAVTATGCASTTRKAVTVNVTPLPATPETQHATICAGSSTTLWVKNPDPTVTYNWYSGGGLVGTGISYETVTLYNSATYYVEAVANTGTACSSASRSAVTVTVVPVISNNFTGSEQTICSGSTPAALTGSLPNGGSGNYSYQWEKSEDGLNFMSISGATEQNYTPAALTIDTWFRRKVITSGPCKESISNLVKITVTPLPTVPTAGNASICAGSEATLNVTNAVSGYTYRWYSAASGGSVLQSGVSFTTPELQSTTTYYVEAVNAAGCVSLRRAVTVSVTPIPGTPVVSNRTICAGSQAVLSVSTPDQSLVYKWYNSIGEQIASGATYTTPNLTATTTYYVEAATTSAPFCVSSRTTVVVTVTDQPAMPLVENTSVCAGSSATLAVLVVDPSYTYKWYTSATGGTPAGSGATYNTGTLTSSRTYYVEAVSAAGCASKRASVAVTVTALPATPAAENVNICAGQPAVLSVSSPDANLSYRWYNAATDGTLLATGETYTTGRLATSETYYVEAVTATGCASTTRKAVTVNVTPLPAAPETENATICAGSSTTLWVKNPDPTLYYNWYSGGALVGTGISYATGVLNNSTTYYVEAVTNTGTACSSASRSTVTVTVTPAISNNFISADQTICSGSVPATLTGSLPNGGGGNYSYQWERSEDGVNFTAISNATTQNYTPNALNITTWFRRKVKAVGPCGEHISNTIQITITPIPATPVADNATICEGGTATLSIKDVTPGYTYRWYTTPVGGSAVVSGNSFTTGNLETTTTFYVEAVNATGCTSTRRTVTVTVMPQPEAPFAADQNICAGEQAILAVEDANGSLTYRWYDGNGTLLATGTTYTTAILNSNTTYYVEAATSATPSCVSGRTAVAVNVASRPGTPLADDVSVCAGSAARLSVRSVVPGITYKWYTVATGGTPIFTGSAYTTSALTSNRTYFVEASTASGCTSQSRKAVTVTVIQQPTMPVVADKTVCSGNDVTLTVSNPDANLIYRWFDQSGTALATGTSYTARALTASTTYLVEAVTTTSPACTSSRESVTVTVTPLPASPVADNATICAGATATLFVKNATPAVTYKWYDDTETLLFTGTTFTTPTLTADAIYYVEASSGSGCINPVRTVVTVYVTQPISNNTISSDQTICSGDVPVKFTGTQAMGGGGNITYQWESSEDGVNFNTITNATGKDYQPAALHVTTWFRRRASIADGLCSDQLSNIIRVRAIPLPATPAASNVTICAGAKAILSVAPENGYTYRWFSVPTGGTSLASSPTFSVEGLQTETRFYVEAVNGNGCISPRKAITVFVTPLPAMPQANDQLICAGEKATLFVTDPDVKLNYRWLDSNGAPVANGSSFTTGNLTQNTIYYVEAYTTTTQACTSQRKAVTVNVQQLPGAPDADNATVCAGSAATLTVKQANTGYTYRWYSVATGGMPLAAGPTYDTGNLTSDRTYFVEAVNSSGCTSTRTAVKVTVAPQPATPQANNKSICAGETVELAITNPDVALNYRWYDGSGRLLANGVTHSVSGLKVSTTFYVEAISGNGCVSPTRKAVVVSVAQLPATPIVGNSSICSGEKVTLFVKNPDPALEYRWYNDAAGTNLIGSGISYTSADALYASRSYYVEAVNTAGCNSATRAQADVFVTAKPGAPVVEDATICSGSSAKLSVVQPDAALVYKWFDANGTLLHTGTTYNTVALSSKATFYVTANTTSSPACSGPSEAVTVNIMTSLANNTVTANQTICSGGTPATLSGSVPTGGGNATLSYQWERSEDGINFVSIVGAYAQNYAPEALTADTWFRRVVRAAGPCSESVSNAVKVSVTALPAMPLADDATICAGSSAALRIKNPSSGASNITYRWYYTASGGTAIGSGVNFTTQPLYSNATYYVEAVNGNGCVSSARRAVTITVIQQISDNTISAAQTICSGSTPATVTGSVAFQSSEPYTYQWQQSSDGGNFTNIPGATGQHYIPNEKLTRGVWYRRVVRSSGPCGDHISNVVKMEVVPLPVAPSVASVSVCPGNSATLQATGLAPGTKVEWYDAPVGGSFLAEGTTFRAAPYATTSYWVQAVNSNNCESPTRKEVKIIVVDPQVRVSGDVTIMQGRSTKLVASGGANYSWSPATGLSDPSAASPIARPAVTTTYTVTSTTPEGCTSTATITVTVVPAIVPMNAMTPNGDGINDVFHVENLEKYPDCRVEIFTRWGEKIFESKGYDNPWNGTRNGKQLPLGAYYYIIYLSKDEAPISGSITIIK